MIVPHQLSAWRNFVQYALRLCRAACCENAVHTLRLKRKVIEFEDSRCVCVVSTGKSAAGLYNMKNLGNHECVRLML
ncbi:hypothetical protein CEXT_762731 [Caerostris extrusa]|uniref:Secreted protein n=1 Tax=Caerostris extrusa TaxID=172846 RepID=A0AAV4YC18_CAEEX|nr:hypothetical protein CEXT_762731 [Caerostris extrusa]